MIQMAKTIPFEIHLTIGTLHTIDEAAFIDCCKALGAKPLLIELSRGTYQQQPMLSIVIYANNFETVLSKANELSRSLKDANFNAKRLKIEVPAFHSELFSEWESAFDQYFEWHGKINYAGQKIDTLCQKHKVHLSVNSLKGAKEFRFITLREYGSKALFENRVKGLLHDAQYENLLVHKQQAEYCIYDNNSYLDEGWLPQ